jgi:predicted adenylyl cyclase CyaB
MLSNIEIKARVHDWQKTKERAGRLAGHSPELIHQEDVFFSVAQGRLKLRIFSKASGELIYYTRDKGSGPRECRYLVSPISNPDSLRAVLSAGLGVRGVVRKERLLYQVGQTQVHLDDVALLGQFIELEVVLHNGQPRDEGIEIARRLMSQLEIHEMDLLEPAYIDLIESPECR